MSINWIPQIMTREIKAANIFGLSTCRFTRLWGQVAEDNEKNDHLAVMPNGINGIHAAIDNIRFDCLFLGMFRPAQFGNHWSGDPKKEYGFELAKVMKMNPGGVFSFKEEGDALLRAMAIMENGDACRDIPPGYFNQFILGES